MRRITYLVIAPTMALALVASSTSAALAAVPEVTHGTNRETFFDGFLFDLCGIETMTTVTEHWTLWRYADGSEKFQSSRMFVPEDPRVPVEYGAGMSTFAPDGTQTVHGSPIRLRRPGEGIILLDAGLVSFGTDLTVHGPHPSLDADLADAYCP